jgi:hypothetical protein
MAQFHAEHNIIDIDATELVSQLVSGDPSAPVHSAISEFQDPGRTAAHGITTMANTPEGAAEIKAWALKQGLGFLKNNITLVQNALPQSGLPMADMPALESEDVDTASDVPTPGGQFNIDLAQPYGGEEEDALSYHQKKKTPEEVVSTEVHTFTGKMLNEKGNFPAEFDQGMPGGDHKDPKDLALAFLTKGLEDAEPDDDLIAVNPNAPINIGDMIPTQNNMQVGKVLAFALSGGFDGQELGGYITRDNEILDGHHRWAGTMIVDPGASILGHQIMAPAQFILPVLRALGNALGYDQKGLPPEELVEGFITQIKNNLILDKWKKMAGLL